jgi:hypothetical protein
MNNFILTLAVLANHTHNIHQDVKKMRRKRKRVMKSQMNKKKRT